jgi:hypothetical protein
MTPSTAKTQADTTCTTRSGTSRVTRSPSQTTGALAIIMPSVVPATTATMVRCSARRACHGGDLRLVAHLGKKEREHRGGENAEARACHHINRLRVAPGKDCNLGAKRSRGNPR